MTRRAGSAFTAATMMAFGSASMAAAAAAATAAAAAAVTQLERRRDECDREQCETSDTMIDRVHWKQKRGAWRFHSFRRLCSHDGSLLSPATAGWSTHWNG